MQQEIDFQRSQTMSAKENEISGGSKESIIGSVMREADELGMDNAELQAYAEHLQKTNELLANNEARAMQVALANMKLNDGLGEIMDSYDDWTALIDETTGLIQVSSSEDAKAFANLKSSINKMLNTTQDLSDDFWESAHNINLVKEAAEGSIDAIAELQVLAMQDYLMHVELEDGQFREDLVALGNYIAEYDLPALEAEAFLDDQAFIDGANDLIRAANMTAEQVAAAFKTMGYDVEFDSNPQPVPSTYHFPETSYTIVEVLMIEQSLTMTTTK